jgi:predicted enzyme related to lactoylglutathione lyase
MAHPVSFFQIQGNDPRALIKFYQKAFGWRGTPAPDGSSMIAAETGGIPGAVGPSSNGSAHLAVYITVDNVTQHLARAKRAGARIAMPETRLPADLGSIGGIIDPAGNWVGLWAGPPNVAPAPAKASKTPPKRPAAKTATAKTKAKTKTPALRAAGRKA